jgi:hypothetical protein
MFPARALFLFLFAALPLGFLTAQIDSGGGMAPLGGGMNHSSVGAPVATDGLAVGLIDILYPPAPELSPDADTDADKLPDSWEISHFGSLTADAGGDSDGDGTTNMMEYLAGTNPQSAASVFRPATHTSGGKLILAVPTVSKRNYRVWGTADLKNGWGSAPLDTIAGDGSTVQWEYLMNQAPRYFLRIEILIPQQN